MTGRWFDGTASGFNESDCKAVCRALALSTVFLRIFAPGCPFGRSIPGYPEYVIQYDPREIALLPKYCPFAELSCDRVPGGNDRLEGER